MVIARPRMTEIGQQKQSHVIEFLHPAYPDGANILLRLYAVDDDGVDFDFAHIACSIIANNTFTSGWLARRRVCGENHEYKAVTRGLLKDKSYYFCIGEDATCTYPIVTRIDEWEFPHQIWDRAGARGDDRRPIATWTWFQTRVQEGENVEPFPVATSDPKMIVRARDRNCRVTGYSEATEVAHLGPSACSSWFDRNGMSRYCSNPIPLGTRFTIDDDKNGILLRRDLPRLSGRPSYNSFRIPCILGRRPLGCFRLGLLGS
ncbi:hypothetical protein F4824DRAFT_154653 [Ustulina deusta]|nr:hypothetical protein F4824DRAFT_428662 [Ustulina deusta]KAI3335351.1 hypothetical protein F4824DRAFT_154653 [Ustulina deusta]